MARERRAKRKYEEYAEAGAYDTGSEADVGVDDSDDDFTPTGKMKKNGKTKVKKEPKERRLPEPPSKATVTILAGSEMEVTENLGNVDQTTLKRIKKALDLSRHPGTTENEAQQALRLAKKLMEKLNISQAQVLESMEEKEDRLKQTGQSVVCVHCQQGKEMHISTWASTACGAVCNLFDVKNYTESGYEMNQVNYVFYGLVPNTVSAAHGFEMVYNLIMQWRIANKEARGLNAKNAYCRGVADGLYHFSINEKRREEKRVTHAEKQRLEAQRKAEEEQRQKEIERLKPLELGDVEVKSKLDTKVRIEDEEEGMVNGGTPSGAYCTEDESDGTDDNDESSEYNFRAFDYSHNQSDNRESERPNADEAVEDDDVVAPTFKVKEEANDIDLDELLKTSEERARQQAEALKQVKEEEDVKPSILDSPVVVKTEQQSMKAEEEEEPYWQSAGALIAFRQTSLLLADEYLKKQDVKLRVRGKKAELKFKDANASQSYDRGWEDSKKIDLKRKRIEAGEE